MDLTNTREFIVQKDFYVRIDNILYKIDVEADSERCSLYGYFLAFDILIRLCRLVLANVTYFGYRCFNFDPKTSISDVFENRGPMLKANFYLANKVSLNRMIVS